jgi:uncharacterized protein
MITVRHQTVQELLSYIDGLSVIDTHEHMPAFEKDREKPTDVLREYLQHYMNSDLISAGLSKEKHEQATDISRPLTERWKLVGPYWDACRHTGYGRCLDEAARGIYGIGRIDGTTIEELNGAFQHSLQPGHYTKVLKDLCGIETSLLDNDESPMESDPEFFRSVFRIDALIFPHTWDDIYKLERLSKVPVVSLDSYLRACTVVLHLAKEKGAIALKIALAYERSLRFDRPDRADAERGFRDLLAQKHIPTWETAAVVPTIPFQNYVLHRILEQNLDPELQFPIQVHTGIHEGSGNHPEMSNPLHLTNLLLEYPGNRFDLFHISYPFQKSAGVIAKNFPNVSLDMCWAHIVSPYGSTAALIEWLGVVPSTKIFGFGGDFLLVDGVYGHLKMAKRNIAAALGWMVENDDITMRDAERLAADLLYNNPKRFFGV